MYIKLKTAKRAGLEISMSKDVLQIDGSRPWSNEEIDAFNQFTDAANLHDRDCDSVSQYVADLQVMRILRQITL